MGNKYKYLDKENLQKINYLSANVLKYNRAIRQEAIDDLEDDKLFPITFSMIHEHRAGVACEPHVRCIISARNKNGVLQQMILDMEMGLFNLLPEVEVPKTDNESVSAT
jgi:hypothetical protein